MRSITKIQDKKSDGDISHLNEKKEEQFRADIVWKNAIGFLVLHLMALYGLYLAFTSCKGATNLWGILIVGFLCEVGVTVGAHRLFSHRAYKANLFLRALLLAFQGMAGQNCLYVWARDHRQHHRYSDTPADPHDSTRGFFFSHVGWLMVRKHPAVIASGRHIDMSDLEADPLVMFQKRYYKTCYVLLGMVIPIGVPCYFWDETFLNAFMVAYALRSVLSLNCTWSVNSVAHLWGNRPYDMSLAPVENKWVSFFTAGEGWHNYHHAFPWDYRCAEHGMRFNNNAWVIEMFAKLGWATDLRLASKGMVVRRVAKCGDGSHRLWGADVAGADEMSERTVGGGGNVDNETVSELGNSCGERDKVVQRKCIGLRH